MSTKQSNGAPEGQTRREFVKRAAVVAAAPVLAGHGLAALAARGVGGVGYVAGSDELRVGIIGCGGRGTGAAVQALRADAGAVLVAMGDIFADRVESSHKGIVEELGDEAGTKVRVPEDRRYVGFECYKRVIDSGVDVVLVTGYPHFRPVHMRAAVEAGKHVFAEKPVAVDAPGVRSVLETAAMAQARHLGCQVGFCWRYNAGMRGVFEEVKSGRIGDVVTVHTTYHSGTLSKRARQAEWSDLEFQMRNWWHFTWISGDHIVEQAIHSVDRMSWAMGDVLPARVTCLGGRAARSGPEHGNVYDHFAAVYEYGDGRRCFHTCRQIDRCPGDNTDYVYGTGGSAVVNGWTPTYVTRDAAGEETWRFRGAMRDMYQQEHDELFASIRAGRPINDCERGARSTLMAVMGRMAAYTGQTITWEQALGSQERLGPGEYEFGPMEMPGVAVPGQTKFV